MGLDMYAYKISKVKEDEIKNIEFLGDLPEGCNYLSINDVEQDEFVDLKPFLIKKRLKYYSYDYDLIKQDYPNFNHISGWEYANNITLISLADSNGETIKEIPDDNYTRIYEDEFYLYNSLEIGYWRKSYDLMDEIKDCLGERKLQNCGYYFLSKNDWSYIRESMYNNHIKNIQQELDELLQNENYDINKKERLERELYWLKADCNNIPKEDCFFHAWW